MKRLLIDLDICDKCEDCVSRCSYNDHPGNDGITCMRELAHFAIVCRRCDDAPCVTSCPWEALEMQPYNALKRYMMRCTSCKSCSRACPFGVIYAETIPFIISRCDFCLSRVKEGESPVCLQSCTHNGVKYGEFDENKEEHIYRVSDYLVIKTGYKWERVLEAPPKKP